MKPNREKELRDRAVTDEDSALRECFAEIDRLRVRLCEAEDVIFRMQEEEEERRKEFAR